MPPVAASLAEYETPTVAAGSEVVFTVSVLIAAPAGGTPKVTSMPAAKTTADASITRRRPANHNDEHLLRIKRVKEIFMTPPGLAARSSGSN
jgi:hypothetical protein